MTRRPRRRFTAEQKAEAVRLVSETSNLSQVARDLDITRSSLVEWVRTLRRLRSLCNAASSRNADSPRATPGQSLSSREALTNVGSCRRRQHESPTRAQPGRVKLRAAQLHSERDALRCDCSSARTRVFDGRSAKSCLSESPMRVEWQLYVPHHQRR